MDSNKYRSGTGTKYKDSSLSEEKSEEFLNRINKRGERKCIAMVKKNVIKDSVVFENEDVVCGKVFMSAGFHNRKCPKCSVREEYAERMNKSREPVVYRARSSGAMSTAFHAEIGE